MQKEKSILLDQYGAHEAPNGLWFLLQNGEAQNARNLDVKNPFVVQSYRGRKCNHHILLPTREPSSVERSAISDILDDDLASLFLPLPIFPRKCVFVTQTSERKEKLYEWVQLGTPYTAPILPAWLLSQAEARAQANLTNIAPYVVTDIDVKWMTQNRNIVSIFQTGSRPLVLMGSDDVILPSDIKRVESLWPVIEQPQELGALALRTFMRGELNVVR